jgi:hypothetical protein
MYENGDGVRAEIAKSCTSHPVALWLIAVL